MTPKHDSTPSSRYVRRIEFREMSQRFLIVCEGRKTEKNYFEAFRVPKDVRFIDVKGLGRNTVSLVDEAIRLKELDSYDQTWCVFDIEDYPRHNIEDAIRLAEANGIQVAYSNEAFEIWYLLHFNYYNTAIPRSTYFERLSELLQCKYEKNSREIYGKLLNRQTDAIRNAKHLFSNYQPPDPHRDNPCTTVYLLVEELNRFSPESRR